jgi:hypothetical protein
MTESLEKLAPITVSVNVADPAGTLDGATDEMEGVAAEGEVGVRGDVDEEVPPQPVNIRQEKGKGQQLHPHNDRHVSWAWGLSCRGFAGEPHRHFIFLPSPIQSKRGFKSIHCYKPCLVRPPAFPNLGLDA